MSNKTKIDWVKSKDGSQGATWNPLRGCSKVSEGCQRCYAERTAARFCGPGAPYEGLVKDGRWTGDVRFIAEGLDKPLHWRKPRTVFVCSMSDLFHENADWSDISRIFEAMSVCPQHTFIVLTKRPERLRLWVLRPRRFGWPLPNVWFGVSAENQAAADERIPILLQIPAVLRFVSVEPMLGPVNLGLLGTIPGEITGGAYELVEQRLHWVIAGCESGSGARLMDPEWVRSLRDQCVEVGVPYFLKQMTVAGKLVKMPELDGKLWDQLPERL